MCHRGVSVRVDAHPLVVAAALGLLGPAALADDEPARGLGGEWTREGHAEKREASLGASFEVIPVEEHFVLGGAEPADQGTWTRMSEDHAVQVVALGSLEVRRSYEADGDTLVVRTRVHSGTGGPEESFVERFNRRG